MALQFKPATKKQARLRAALIGPAGSGKTYSSLSIATHLVPDGRVAVIDTEHGSASKYAGDKPGQFKFDTLELDTFSPETYVEAIHAAEDAGFDVLVIDSLSHAWMGKDGALEQVDNAAKRERGNSFGAWRNVTPKHNALVEAIIGSKCHIIATMRAKTEYSQEKDDRGKTVVRKIGLAPVQRDGLEYEFDVTGDIDLDNNYVISKTRCPVLAGKVFAKPGKALAEALYAWLTDGAPPAVVEPQVPVARPSPQPMTKTDVERFAEYHARIAELSTEAECNYLVNEILKLPEGAERKSLGAKLMARKKEIVAAMRALAEAEQSDDASAAE